MNPQLRTMVLQTTSKVGGDVLSSHFLARFQLRNALNFAKRHQESSIGFDEKMFNKSQLALTSLKINYSE